MRLQTGGGYPIQLHFRPKSVGIGPRVMPSPKKDSGSIVSDLQHDVDSVVSLSESPTVELPALRRPSVSFNQAAGLRIVVLTPLRVDTLCKKSAPLRFVSTHVDLQRVKQRFYAVLLRMIMKTSCPLFEPGRLVTGIVFVSSVDPAARVCRTLFAGLGVLVLHQRYGCGILLL